MSQGRSLRARCRRRRGSAGRAPRWGCGSRPAAPGMDPRREPRWRKRKHASMVRRRKGRGADFPVGLDCRPTRAQSRARCPVVPFAVAAAPASPARLLLGSARKPRSAAKALSLTSQQQVSAARASLRPRCDQGRVLRDAVNTGEVGAGKRGLTFKTPSQPAVVGPCALRRRKKPRRLHAPRPRQPRQNPRGKFVT